MGYQMEWLIDGRVGIITVSGDVDSTIADHLNKEAVELAQTATALVHYLVDMRQLDKLDYRIGQRITSPSVHDVFSAPNVGWFVYIIPKEKHHIFLTISYLQRQFEAQVKIVHHYEDGIDFLNTQDPSLQLKNV